MNLKKGILISMISLSSIMTVSAQWNGTSPIWTSSNVSIGTTIAYQQLSITGGIGFANQNSLDKKLYSPNDGTLEWLTHDFAGEHGFAVSHQGERRIYLNTNGNSYFIGGNVGIGTTTPYAKLSVKDGVDINLGIKFGQTDATAIMFNAYNDAVNANIPMEFRASKYNFTNGNVGIGTTNPTGKLDIMGPYAEVSLNANAEASANFRTGGHVQMAINTSVTYPYTTSLQSKHATYDGSSFPIALNPLGGNVGIGTINPDSKLTVKGKIHAEEVKIDLAVPADYVFEKCYLGESSLKPDYTLLTLSEVEKFTKKNHHLPNVPSAKEIKENGLHIGEMSNILLQKIEELTLYSIGQQKTIEKQVAEIDKLKKENESFGKFEERLIRLEKEVEAKK